MKRVQFIGLDVHADTIAVAVAEPGGTVPQKVEVGSRSGSPPGALTH